MWINIIDYRGDNTVIDAKGNNLFDYRTKYLIKMQEDFAKWQRFGHKFRCFTQHTDNCHDSFDDVVRCDRSNIATARNTVLDYYDKDEWIGLWDNDATLYWNKLKSNDVPEALDEITELANKYNVSAWVPFNPRQSPYKPVGDAWSLTPTLRLKGTLAFYKIGDERHNTDYDDGEDLEYACELTQNGKCVAVLDQASLNELVTTKSTIYEIGLYRQPYKKPGAGAHPEGMRMWDSTADRRDKLAATITRIEERFDKKWKDIQKQQKDIWTEGALQALEEELQDGDLLRWDGE